ncbi:hypothetical protein KIW84_072152 [Lathyrus oleraceus]|uniref:Uncharacterized protein n=1 Tax=Pisum sativum TaxID=3888 RepID=A0A9D4VKI0_PEA|nr:hypothetical protein KIW84_072152 [Pisum sativum]
MYEVNGMDHVNAKVDALTQKIENLTITPAAVVAVVAPNCELCGTPGNTNVECKLLASIPTDQIIKKEPMLLHKHLGSQISNHDGKLHEPSSSTKQRFR